MKADLHIHTFFSHDAINYFNDIEIWAKKRKLDYIAITDHERIDGALKALKSITNVGVIPGIEFYTEYGHLIGINITEKPPKRSSIWDIIDFIKDNNGISILAHPLDKHRSGEKDFKEILNKVDAIEVANSHDPKAELNYIILMKIAEDLNIGVTAGSDSHIPETIGYAYVEDDSEKIEDLIENLLKRRVKIRFRKASSGQKVKKILLEVLHKARLYRPSPPEPR